MNHKLAPLTGVAFFAALLASILTSVNLSNDSSGTKVLTHYSDAHDKLVASMILTVIAVFIGVIYFGVLRDYLGQNEKLRGVAATAFGGVVIFAVGGAVSAGAMFALIDSGDKLSPATAQTMNVLNQDAGAGLSSSGIAILLFCYGLAIVQSGLLPKWLGWVALPFAVIALVPEVAWISFIVTGLWVLVTSIVLYVRRSNADAGTEGTPARMATA